jgi:hypothetical protein
MRADDIERERRIAEIEAFAVRHGLTRLTRDHLVRMSELAAEVARGGQAVRRAPRKEDGPAPVFRVLGR